MPVIRADCTEPGSISQRRSTARPSRMFHQPPSWAVCTAKESRPAADEHQHDAGDAEELREVDLHAAPVDEVAEHARERDTEQRAGAGEARAVGLLERGQQEHRGLEAFAEDGEERHRHETDRRALDQRERRALPADRP